MNYTSIANRLKEPSTYAGLSSLLGLAVLAHLIPSADVSPLVHSITEIGMGLGGLLAIVLKETGVK